jgi:hypothetical protein
MGIMVKNIGIFILGCFLGASALGLIHTIKKTGDGFKNWDRTDIYSDQEVRTRIRDSGIALPADSWNLFYAIDGFRDHGVWITLTVPTDQLWKVVEASLHKTKADFAAGIPESFLPGVELGGDQKIDTTIWNPQAIKIPLHFSIKEKNSYFEDWVVDEDTGRIFVTKSNT